MVPQVGPVQPLPLMLQVTMVFDVLATVAVNCLLLPANKDPFVGAIVTDTGNAIVTTADADFVLSAFDVAVTVTIAGFGTWGGAV
jgi:uncharacterized protein with NRDE domain